MIYYLDKAENPTIPVPHDCMIESISLFNDFLILDFEQDIAIHDSVQFICPNAKSLTIKIHLIDDIFSVYQEKIRKFPKFKKSYEEIGLDRLVSLVKQKSLAYLYHYVAYQSLIINLDAEFILYSQADYIEYIWKT